MFPKLSCNGRAAVGVGDSAGGRRALNAPSGAGDREGKAADGHRAGGINQEKIEHHVDPVHRHAHPHGRFGIPHRTKDRTENNAGAAEQHWQVQNEEIPGRHIPNGGVYLHPDRHLTAQRHGEDCKQQTRHQHCQHRLARRPARAFLLPRAEGLGNKGQKAHAKSGDCAADQPVYGAGGPHRRRSLSPQRTNHCRVNVLYRRLHQLFQHGGPRQCQNHRQQFPKFPSSCSSHFALPFPLSLSFDFPPTGWFPPVRVSVQNCTGHYVLLYYNQAVPARCGISRRSYARPEVMEARKFAKAL